MSNDLNSRITVSADTREAEADIDRFNDKITSMGDAASEAGAKASIALDGVGKSSEMAASNLTRSETAMDVALRRTVEQMELAARQSKSLADSFQFKAEIGGFDTAKFDPMLERLRQLESQLSVAKSAEKEFAAQNAFAQKSQQTTELIKAAQYTNWWAAELEKVDAAERKLAAETAFVDSLKSQAAAIGKTQVDLLELQAAQMGVTSQAEPFIAKLREAESGVGRMGVSAEQTRAALAQLPMQFSDIVASWQSGQAPLTVLLQKGMQIKDSFGGAGAAFKAMSGYVMSLINPYTVAAVAIDALGAAMADAEGKLRDNMTLMAQLEATGRAGYLNSDAVKQLKKDMADLPGISKSMASAIIADLVQVRTLGGEALQKIALLSADFAVATGQTAADAAKELAKAMDDPAKAARALDEAFNFLTLEQLIAIDAMVEAGDKAAAQEVVLDALGVRVKDLAENSLTPLQTATENFGDAWDQALSNVANTGILTAANGLVAGLVNRFAELVGWLSQMRLPDWMEQSFKGGLNGMVYRAIVGGNAPKPAFTGGATGSWGENSGGVTGSWGPPSTSGAKSTADQELAALLESTKGFKAKKDAADELGKTLSRLHAHQERLRVEGRGDTATAQEVQAHINGVTEQIKTLNKTRGDGSKKEQSTYTELADSIQAKINVNKEELGLSERLSEAQKAEIKLTEDLKNNKIKLSDSQEAKIRKDIEEWKQLEKAKTQVKQNVAIYEQQLDVENQITEDYVKRSKALESARLAMDAYEIAAQEDHDRLQLEAGLVGMSNQARTIALAQFDTELELKRKIAAINAMDTVNGDADRAELRNRARAVAGQKMANAQTKAYLTEWERAYEQTSQMLTDALMSGGKNGGELLSNYFRTLVFRPIVKAMVDPYAASIARGVQSFLGQGPDSAGGGMPGGGFTDWSSWGSSASGWASDASFKLVSNGWQDMGSSMMDLSRTIGSVDTYLKDIPGMSGGIGSAAGYLGALYSLSQGKVGSAAGAAIGTYIFPGIGTMIGSALGGLLDGLDNSGTKHMGAGAIYSKVTGVQDGAGIYNQGSFGMGHRDEYSAAIQEGVSGIAKGLGETLDAFAVSFGKTAGYSVATAFADDSSKDGSWGSLKIADELGQVLINWDDTRSSKWAPREFADGEAGNKEYLNAIAVDMKNVFLEMDLPAWADQILKTAKDIDTLNASLQQIATVKTVFEGLGKTLGIFAGLSGDLQTRLLNASGGIEALANNAGAFHEGFYTEGERVQTQRELQMQSLAGMGLYIDPYQGDAAKEMFRLTVEEAMKSGQMELAAKLMAMSTTFKTTADYGQKLLDDLAGAAKNAAETAKQAAADTLAVMVGLAQGFASQMTAAHSAMDTAGALWDRLDAAQGGSGTGYARIREQRLWDAMVQADYKQQIELAGQLTDMVLSRHQLEQDNAQKLLDFGKSLRDYVEGLKIGALSPLTTGEKLAEAGRQYADTLAKAQAGDATAMGSLQGVSTSYLDLARQYFASSGDYTKIFNSVTGSLDALGMSSQTEAQLQLDVSSQSLVQLRQLQGILVNAYGQAESEFAVERELLQRQVDEMLRTAEGIEAVRDLLGSMPAELSTLLNGGTAIGTGSFATLAQRYVSLLGGVGGSSTDAGYVASAMGHMDSANWKAELSNAMGLLTDPGARSQMQAIFDAVAKMKGIDGAQAKGLGYVPFDNYTAQLPSGARVLVAQENRADTPSWSSYGTGSGAEALVSEIKALRAEVSQLKESGVQNAQMLARATVESNKDAAGDVVLGVGRVTERAAYAETVQPKGYK